ncbi:MAG: S-layer protein PS2 [Corynebacterium sp.]|uniref:S-layer protein PS2 n=1 Tax=Corynebacterium sp. TaxID=1720 RepID=UPI0026DF3835|nr:S-layer protein PS2 [Corynebacterium sp.]MDO5670450.1 S-layer protein PS2 [Corynebacterium sp.]
MFQNRIRTAALAGAIAVATGISGLATPAFAVDTTQQDGYNNQDGSASAPVVAQNITENELRSLTDGTADYLYVFQNDPSFTEIVDEYINLGQDGFDPSEQAAQKAFDDARQVASAELATASANIQKARNSVAYALEKDQIAEADWKAFVKALNDFRAVINPLINDVNDKNTHVAPYFPVLETIPAADGANAVSVFRAIQALQAEVNRQFELAGDWNIDIQDGQYVNREHMIALENLKNAVDAGYPALKAAYDTAVASNREAQKSDVIVRQLYLERATAQRDTLRAVEAYFSVVARYIELFQNNEIVGETTLRTLYREVLHNIWHGIKFNVRDLQEADAATHEYHLAWESDLRDNDDEKFYFEQKLDFATKTYLKIFKNGRIWGEELERVELIDTGIKAEREAEAARLAAERAAVEQAEADRQALIDALKELADAQNPGTNPAPNPLGSSFGSSR